ncbi:MAG: molybdenum cofactor biosynthesis protein MoaE [Gammaproteobacteria bacterium]|nr:molybdenum cofactor biosynthesis protein MoaE [Gammaproteobacteria bacterium]NND39945.1 molybdenum cofactor biosynthesis protein MoaE [Pseudomonadales bacterium]MBT8152148.1 molybdenum cofactor biosynthesis protein MoaE [Gammaproteobacteria bacterium]NNL10524.1 molybdenum cofactor biosynthesis protein MoaE [Pseudomonadales bacterium]NNM10654.1 molybdenum cofactor biosynthesis protein MoaE [Pseudomonadales bacterium]
MQACKISISVQRENFTVSDEQSALQSGLEPGGASQTPGAIVSFVGLVRDEQDAEFGALQSLQIEHYPGMTEQALGDICQRAGAQWQLIGCRVVHRVGSINSGEQIVLVMTAAAHRGDAFCACEYIMDYLKTAATFWKKACYESGARWVAAQDSDQQRLQRWAK